MMLIAPTDPTGLDLIISINQDRRQVGNHGCPPPSGRKDVSMNNELYHFGVKGMKWGVRRARKKYSNKALRQYNANQRNVKSLKRDLDSGIDSDTGSKLDFETRKAYQYEYNRAVETGKKWLKTRQDILNMPVSSTTVSDIKNRYNKTRRGNVYYPFA